MARCKDCIHSKLCKDMHKFGVVDLPYNDDNAACEHYASSDDVVMVRRGKWIPRTHLDDSGFDMERVYYDSCSYCGFTTRYRHNEIPDGMLYCYCPNCGAKMEDVET